MWTLTADHEVPVWRFGGAHDVLAFSTRRGGVSVAPFDSLNLGRSVEDTPASVEENRRRLLARVGVAVERLATAGQVHGTQVALVDGPGHTPACDGLVTRVPGLALAVTAADCLPVLMTSGDAVAAVHAGWRGTAARIVTNALELLTPHALRQTVQAHLGPCIRVCCYEVGTDVAARFDPSAVRRTADGALHLDLIHAVRAQLLDAGVLPTAIHDTGACTACDSSWYFSHRREAGKTGRLWGLVAMRARP